ncbi:hypothetical protein ACLB2K_002064 [Fragaria x ananassa]
MSCFELPKHLCNAIHSSLARFWWGDNDNGKKIHWLSWDKLCVPKSEGGMGFRNMTYFNRALLAKQGWRLLRRSDALVARLLKAKYFSDTDFLHATCGSDPSFVWRSLLVERDTVLKKGMRFTVLNRDTMLRAQLIVLLGMRPLQTIPDELEGNIGVKCGRLRCHQRSGVSYGRYVEISSQQRLLNLHRKFHVSDMTCVFCNKGVETGLHMFWDCSVACIFWKHNPLHLKSQSFPGATIAEWIGVVMDRLSGQQLDVFFVSLWALWTERYNIFWKGRSCDPFNMSIWALQFLEDYKKVHNKLKVKMKRASCFLLPLDQSFPSHQFSSFLLPSISTHTFLPQLYIAASTSNPLFPTVTMAIFAAFINCFIPSSKVSDDGKPAHSSKKSNVVKCKSS